MRFHSFLLLATIALVQVGCSSAPTTAAQSNVDSNGQPVSAVPWNKPETWETTGQLGSMSQ